MVLPCRTVQLEPIWPVEVPLRAGVMALPGLLKSQDLPFDISLCSVSSLLLAAHKVIIVLSQGCPVPAEHSGSDECGARLITRLGQLQVPGLMHLSR